jgi:hypothetical protein
MIKRKKGKRTNNDPQNTTQKTKDRATRTPLKNVEQTLIIHHRGTKQHQWCNKEKQQRLTSYTNSTEKTGTNTANTS